MKTTRTPTAALLATTLLAACGGGGAAPTLMWQPNTITLTSTGTATGHLVVVPGDKLLTPSGPWTACIYGGTKDGATVSSPCVTFQDCDKGGCAADIVFQGAFAGTTPPAGLATVVTTFRAEGPSAVNEAFLGVFQTP